MILRPRGIVSAAPLARRTYLCLEGLRNKPTDYQITTTALLYYTERGFEVETPVAHHYAMHQLGSGLRMEAWDAFEDPAHLTYSAYVAERREQEVFLDRVFERSQRPMPTALEPLVGVLSALRFPFHALQMVAAYVGALAPGGRIAVTAALQAADELRCIQQICRWLSRCGKTKEEVDVLGRQLWQEAPEFQPLRQLIERLLITYDWAAALTTLNGVVKPVLARLCLEHLALAVHRHGDAALEKLLRSLGDDAHWHEAWFATLAQSLVSAHPENAVVVRRAAEASEPAVMGAMRALLPAFGGIFGDQGEREQLCRELELSLRLHWIKCGIVNAEAEA